MPILCHLSLWLSSFQMTHHSLKMHISDTGNTSCIQIQVSTHVDSLWKIINFMLCFYHLPTFALIYTIGSKSLETYFLNLNILKYHIKVIPLGNYTFTSAWYNLWKHHLLQPLVRLPAVLLLSHLMTKNDIPADFVSLMEINHKAKVNE